MARNPNVIREGDRVQIVVPIICVRVGYPKQVADYLEAAQAKYTKLLREDMEDRQLRSVLDKIAYGMAKADGFGGRERTLHTKEVPSLADQEFTVSGVRTVRTGTYFPPRSWEGWTSSGYDSDYESGGLSNQKTYRLATGFGWSELNGRNQEIQTSHLKKL